MSTLNDAKMPSLIDKHLAQEAERAEAKADKGKEESKKGKGSIRKSKSKKK